MPPSSRVAVSLMVSLSLLVVGSSSAIGRARIAQHEAAMHGGIPPAAAALAQRLDVRSRASVGDQPAGSGRPWTIWFRRTVKPGSVGPGNVPRHYLMAGGRALFTGPRGALGEFHYFDLTPVSTSQVADPYRGPPLTRVRVIRITLEWLRHAGVPVPRGVMHVNVRSGTTDIGGTGLCCFTSLAIVYWGLGSRVGSFLTPAKYEVYVADAGTVVQVDMGAPAAEGAETAGHPCPGDRQDRNGVALGRWCFFYPDAARGIIFSEVSYHDGWIHDPDMLAIGPLSPILSQVRHAGPVRRLSLTPTRGVYRQTVKGTTYQVMLIPAFPGLVGSTWEIASVRTIPAKRPPARMRS